MTITMHMFGTNLIIGMNGKTAGGKTRTVCNPCGSSTIRHQLDVGTLIKNRNNKISTQLELAEVPTAKVVARMVYLNLEKKLDQQ